MKSSRRTSSDSVFDEPHMRQTSPGAKEEAPVDSVWMEPGRQADGQPNPYAEWYEKQKAGTTTFASWRLTLLLSLIAGPLAVFSAFFTRAPGAGYLLIVVAGPLIEEVGKVMGPLMVVERNPARFITRGQILFCALISGLVFSVIENFLYLKVYIRDPTPLLIWWRWTVCVGLHVGCSLIAGLGVAKIWQEADQNRKPPKLETGLPLLITAVVLHGVYNLLAILLDRLFV
ncbi:MAG: PrsW family intramembrane metalloprotease [Verrucomicrobia bacterium]|nr:PrsW family intramembrane metalloprotease [Verrucomicrobiota bacterium]MCH8513030.1 PrsW family intramembrane metalloprotease [Kiritimatiellia bacterium]